MSSIEQIVRPFQSPNTVATRRIIATNAKIDVPNAIRSWGKAGTLPSARKIEEPEPPDPVDPLDFSFRVLTCNDKYEEVERKTNPVKIEQEGNPANFVVVDRIAEITFTKGGSTSADKVATSYTTSWTIGTDYRAVLNDNKACNSRYVLTN